MCDCHEAYKKDTWHLRVLLSRLLVVTHLRRFARIDSRSHTMAPQTRQQNDIVDATNDKQNEANTSLDPDVDYKSWKPDRNVKMALAIQTFCVVR
jgi:hypothetical protein